MAAVYLAAHLLKDLTPELFTHDALGPSLTCNINQSLQAAAELRCYFNPFRHITPVQNNLYDFFGRSNLGKKVISAEFF